MSHYRIVLADDHTLLRQGLKKIIDGKADLTVVGEAGDGVALLNLMKKTTPHMAILDISMPILRGIEATAEIKKSRPEVKALILTMHKDVEFLNQSFAAGADGYLLKENADTELFLAIEKLRQGTRYVSPQLMDMVTDDWVLTSRGIRRPTGGPDPLTSREREVLKLMAEGRTSKEIADLLFISSRTVEHHRASIMDKLNLKKTADAVRYALQRGYV